jgi:hypothetical protein
LTVVGCNMLGAVICILCMPSAYVCIVVLSAGVAMLTQLMLRSVIMRLCVCVLALWGCKVTIPSGHGTVC